MILLMISCCCTAGWQSLSYSAVPVISTDVCGNTYDTCGGTNNSGGAMAVPTVLTALVLMVPLSCEHVKDF